MRDLSKLVDQLSRLTLGEASELRKMLETQWMSRQSLKTRMRFTKARGLTASEKLLAELCERSFLSLWSYPNLYRKQAKELIDLIVIFGDDLILFSDKSCAFPDGGDAELDWERWFRRSITKSAAQITQAEDWMKRQPERVYLDVKATQRLPLALPPADRMRVHRILIALNASERCKAATGYPTLEVGRFAWPMKAFLSMLWDFVDPKSGGRGHPLEFARHSGSERGHQLSGL